ncbi:LrgB family protein [Rhodovarius crocodyli]|uniref:LrgB family protein n=1 Tax=Rhodovarius crocodyli TaxID=1979269 RepID=A0A437MJL3_9PROT|nr:LrgB family protein [Rhodovarius crocodyli]RVT97806.1 LrgB family protein [Rhodovarius crocodyli]
MSSLAWLEAAGLAAFWSAATIGLYVAAKRLNQRLRRWWSSPLVLAPVLLIALLLALHASYRDYIGGTRWLLMLMGPATVAFAVPIYEQRAMIRRFWPVLAMGVAAGSGTSILTAYGLASLLGLNGDLRLSLLPRSLSTPFAMVVSGDIGGVPDLTAVFVICTGVFGAAFGEALLVWLPLRSSLARGALFGMGAHGAGVAKAHQIGAEEGTIAGLVMVMVGLTNVLAAPLLAMALR